jgi:hypothetical protein
LSEMQLDERIEESTDEASRKLLSENETSRVEIDSNEASGNSLTQGLAVTER